MKPTGNAEQEQLEEQVHFSNVIATFQKYQQYSVLTFAGPLQSYILKNPLLKALCKQSTQEGLARVASRRSGTVGRFGLQEKIA